MTNSSQALGAIDERVSRALVVIDPGPGADLLRVLLTGVDVEPHTSSSAAEAMRRADEDWSLIVVDSVLAADDGFRVVRGLRARLDAAVPIILLTPLGDVESRKLGLDHGADDFLVAPPTALEVGVRVAQALRLRELGRELTAARDALALAALGDPATGLYSPRALSDRLGAEYARARRYKRPLVVLVAGIERVGRAGELAGDHQLAAIGLAARAALRQTDFLARSANNELAVVAPETSEPDGRLLADRLRARLADLNLSARVSFGVASTDDRLVAAPGDLLVRARASRNARH